MAFVLSRLCKRWELALPEMSGVSSEGALRGACQGGFLNIYREGCPRVGGWVLSVSQVCVATVPLFPVLSAPRSLPASPALSPCSPCPLPPASPPRPLSLSLLLLLIPLLALFLPPCSSLLPHHELLPFPLPWPLCPSFVPATLLSLEQKAMRSVRRDALPNHFYMPSCQQPPPQQSHIRKSQPCTVSVEGHLLI